MKVLLIVFIFLFTHSVSAQLFIQGKIFDSESRNPLPYAHIVLLNENIGTLSNNDGYFEIKSGNNIAHLQISYVGYETKLVDRTLNDTKKDEVIYLTPKVFTINEVVISPDRIESLIKALYNNYKNKKNNQYSAEAFYRDYSTVDSLPVNASEIFYKLNINQSGIGDWNFIQGRAAEAKIVVEEPSIDFLFTSVINNSFFIRNLSVTEFTPSSRNQNFNRIVISPICEDPKKNYFYEKIGEKIIDNQEVSVIKFYPRTSSGKFRFNGKLEVIEDDLQVIYLEISLNHPMFFYKSIRVPFLEKRNQYIDSCYFKHIWQYNKTDNDWMLERIENLISFQVRSKADKSYHKINNTTSQIYLYNYNVSDLADRKTQIIKENDVKLIRNNNYEPDFWQNHSKVISEIPFESNIKKSLLENGFYGNLFPGGISPKYYSQCSDLENKIIRKLNENYNTILKYSITILYYYAPEKEINLLFNNEISPIYNAYIEQIINHKIPADKLTELDATIKKITDSSNVTDIFNLWKEMNPQSVKNILNKLQQFENKYNK
jgi:hypothetical protein